MVSRGSLPSLILACSAIFGISCGSAGDGGAFGAGTKTLVTVEPQAFRGDVVCGDYAGAMRSYVVTLTDVTTSPPFQLASSGPIPCQLAVSFAYVVPSHGYTATIEAYDREDLVPLGGAESGSPVMLDAESKERVAPTFTARCELSQGQAQAGAAAIAQSGRDIKVRGCSPLVRTEPSSESRISLTLSPGALGGLVCGDETGQVERYAVVPAAPELAPHEAGCDESIAFDVEPGRLYGFELRAFQAGDPEPRWASRCQGTSQAGTTLPASCTPLSSSGTIRLRVGELLSSRGRECSARDIERYDILLDGKVVIAGASCTRDAVVGPLAPGSHALTFVGLGRSDDEFGATVVVRCPPVEVSGGERMETDCSP